jgi:chloramphenicol O-acetyltransferase
MKPVNILDYHGFVDQKKIDYLLEKLKSEKDFHTLYTTVGKRVYSISVECLENIARYTIRGIPDNFKSKPFFSVTVTDDKVVIRSGNPVYENTTEFLKQKLNKVNNMTKEALAALYERNINRESLPEDNGAGLGFIIIKLKSGNKIDYNFTNLRNGYSYFNMQVSINKFMMKKLIIEKTACSPGVVLDPDRNLFVISGESRPPDVANFYGEIIRWFNDFTHSPLRTGGNPEAMNLNFDFEYFNSSSAKYLLDLCKQIAHAHSEGMDIKINWHYDENDLDMLEAGKEMSRIAKFPFEFIHSQERS